ncbi:unnamed protein product [Jaminaea pallidilutea]
MGVQGLWSLLQPAARPIKLEDLEGKRFAVDSSIWLYHFRMAMRDKEGRTLANAHILGFFWRICKLLHFGLRPVFVFDGGAPVMKRQTLIGRKSRRQGAKESHALAAKKLLNAQMRQAALAHVADQNGGSPSRSRDDDGNGPGIGGNVVYFDDYGAPGGQASSSRSAAAVEGGQEDRQKQRQNAPETSKSQSPTKPGGTKTKNIDYHRDPYALPSLDQDINALTASTSRVGQNQKSEGSRNKGRRNDFRFATDAELRHLLTSIAPSDIDMTSPLFRSLPSELQYELVGDMRAASRGTSYKRLQAMLKTSPTAIDFSRAQIQNLKTRNELTQRVLDVTDEIGDAHIKVPVRVAGERSKEYVLVRKQGDEGGFVLGVRNREGTSQDKAIVVGGDTEHVDISSDEEDSDEERSHRGSRVRARHDEDDDVELDEVEVPASASPVKPSRVAQPSDSPSQSYRASDANNPEVRRALAEQLLTKRAEEHIKEKMREKGIVNEDEVLEEQLRFARQRLQEGGRGEELFSRKTGKGRSSKNACAAAAAALTAYYDQDEDADDIEPSELDPDGQLEKDELQDLAVALASSEKSAKSRPAESTPSEVLEVSDDEGAEETERAKSGSEAAASPAMEDVDADALESFDASEYAALLEPEKGRNGPVFKEEQEDDIELEDVEPARPSQAIEDELEEVGDSREADGSAGPVLGFRRSDRPGLPGRMDPKLFQRRKWYDEDDEEGQEKDLNVADSVQETERKTTSPQKHVPAAATSQRSPAKQHATSPTKSSPLKSTLASANDIETLPIFKTHESPFKKPASSTLPQGGSSAAPQKNPLVSTDKDSPAAAVRTDEQGRPEPEIQPLPKGDDAAATALLNGKISPSEVENAQRTPASRESQVETEAANQLDTDAELVDAPAEPAFAPQKATEEQAQGVAGVAPTDIGASSAQKEAQRATLDQTTPSPEEEEGPGEVHHEDALMTTDVPLDNEVSVAKEVQRSESPEQAGQSPPSNSVPVRARDAEGDSDEGTPIEWSPSPSPEPRLLGADGFPLPSAEELEQMDAEYEAEAQAMQADQSDIASFISNTKGQGLIEAQAQLAREVQALKAEHVNTKKSEEEITRQMAKEIQMMLRLFGLPYITAPMEAEAQCAELVSRKLVDGIITDDSDVFLFGGTRIYKNLFNNNKIVECFLLSDVQRELGLDREKLVRLAYLLGSDYTEGLPSVGPVVAMEILSLFPGTDGLLRFKDWWTKVQSGQDTPEDTRGKTMRRIKKTLSSKVHIGEGWPNAAVLDAYYEPAVDSSEEPFQWGLPDLDNLRTYLAEYLGWPTTKTDQYVVPVIEAQSRRSRARGNQSTLDRNGFFDVSGGTGIYAGRNLPKYGSSRLQNVVDGFRHANKAREQRKPPPEGTRNKGQSLRESPRQASQRGSDVEEDGDVSMVAIAEGGVPEERVGKEMGKSRPIVRREQMRVSRQEAQKELDANIRALEGESAVRQTPVADSADHPQKKRNAKDDGQKKQKRQKQGVPEGDEDASDEGDNHGHGNGEEDEQQGADRTAGNTRGRGRGRGRGNARGRGRGRGTASSRSAAADRDADTAPRRRQDSTDEASRSSPPRARKPARARGARGGPRHAHLAAGRSMRLDGPIPDSVSEPLRYDRGREHHGRHSVSRSTSASSLNTATVNGGAAGGGGTPARHGTTPARERSESAATSRRIEIELRSDEEDSSE